MDEKKRTQLRDLRKLESADAADWIIENHQVDESVGVLISHLSWKRADQKRLARHFLQRLPHGTDLIYKRLLSFMSVRIFLQILEEQLVEFQYQKNSSDLLMYCLEPALIESARTDRDIELVKQFLSEMNSRISDE